MTGLPAVDRLCVASIPGQGGHVPGHDDRPDGVVRCHLDLVLRLQLEEVRPLVFVLLPAGLAKQGNSTSFDS